MQNVVFDEQISAREAEEIKTEIRKIFAEVKRNKEKMDNDGRDIEKIKIRTRAILENLEKMA